MRCMSSSSNSRNATRRHTFWFRNPAHEEIAFAHEEIAFAHEEKRNAREEIAFPDWVARNTPCTRADILNRLRAGFALLHFPMAVFEAGLKDPQNDNGRCGSVRLTRPFRKAPNRCPIRDSSQKERPTLEFFSQER